MEEKISFMCEYCANSVPTDEYMKLSENELYYRHGAYIVHEDCRFGYMYEPNKIIERYESLILIQELYAI